MTRLVDVKASPVILPPWAAVTDKRVAHIQRVVLLIESWAQAIGVPAAERLAWHDSAQWHDALRDAQDHTLRGLLDDYVSDADLLHGPAVAARLEADGERRIDVLEAVRWHTVGAATWSRTGRALYMADFLEPGRAFSHADRAFLARQVVGDFDGTLRQVVRLRLEWALSEGKGLLPATVALWNAVR